MSIIKDYFSFQNGYAFKAVDFVSKGEYKVIKIKELKDGLVKFFDDTAEVNVPVDFDVKKYIVRKGDVLFALTGDPVNKPNPLSWVGRVSYYNHDEPALLNQRVCKAISKGDIPSEYLYYFFRQENELFSLASKATGSASQANISTKTIEQNKILIPDSNTICKIVDFMKNIDDKINTNEMINRNLSEQALAIYRKMFVETNNNARVICRTDEFFDITIGKTPPRKEKEWFSNDPNDCVWISISDMGSCGIFITDSSEYLTQASVDKYNVKVVPENTVILSFKLTVGRIAITVGKTTTNEAIAHFNTSKKNITEYLYCYLKSFDFGALGSTSSIGTAVNSKTIKTMKFVIPEEWELQKFYDIARPMFEQIKKNQFENQNLVTIRDVLLPKLMVGELDVSDLNI